MIKFEEKSTLGRGTHIVVKQLVTIGPSHSKYRSGGSNSSLLEKGCIRDCSGCRFQYYEPITNELNAAFEESDIERLKERVRQHLSK